MGIGGAALGSSLAEMVSLIFFVVYTSRRIDCRKYGLNRLSPFHFATLKKIFPVSFWTMIQSFISLSTWFLFFLFIEHLGKEALAITNVIRSISGLLFMVVAAFAATCSSLVSNLIGAGKGDYVLPTVWQHIRLAYLFVLPLALLLFVVPRCDIGHIHRYPQCAGRCRDFVVGVVFVLFVHGSCTSVFPVDFGYR